ncbi:hypothetical protein [Corynebacterium terpenotabidum]|uniref:Uncharacterized protein n=1 Tax=Corynebacterium terpenotabidum Y-11 TaxID=1200352 RepID=S4XHI1_9CORY|nr:hypothetical protein [Corynebacterium terpenotabidum]AGP30103.1 hypothetical protein A606_02250 [Corynebacterium terpenotabidum Y-11]
MSVNILSLQEFSRDGDPRWDEEEEVYHMENGEDIDPGYFGYLDEFDNFIDETNWWEAAGLDIDLSVQEEERDNHTIYWIPRPYVSGNDLGEVLWDGDAPAFHMVEGRPDGLHYQDGGSGEMFFPFYVDSLEDVKDPGDFYVEWHDEE